MSQQGNHGGFAYTTDEEYPLLDAEIALGLYVTETKDELVRSGDIGRIVWQLTDARKVELPPLAMPEGAP